MISGSYSQAIPSVSRVAAQSASRAERQVVPAYQVGRAARVMGPSGAAGAPGWCPLLARARFRVGSVSRPIVEALGMCWVSGPPVDEVEGVGGPRERVGARGQS